MSSPDGEVNGVNPMTIDSTSHRSAQHAADDTASASPHAAVLAAPVAATKQLTRFSTPCALRRGSGLQTSLRIAS